MSRRFTLWVLVTIVVWNLVACGWFASAEPTSKRFWDERFGVANVEKAVVGGTLRPENAWYGRLSYLPQAAVLVGIQSVHELVGFGPLELFEKPGRLSGLGYLVVRGVTVLYGVGSLILTFLIGRRIFSSEAALLGTLLLATSPWVLRHFVTFKPDALVQLLVLATFYWSLDAAERPSSRSFALAGVGVGLAASAKYTGALAAVVVIAAAVAAWDGGRRALERLAIAGSCSAAVFLLLHPDLGAYLHYLRLLDRFYSGQGSNSVGSMLSSEVSSLLHWSFHGPWIGVIALAGLGALSVRLVRLVRANDAGPRLRRLALFVSFPLGYSIVFALATSWPKANNYLVIVPFSSLAAAWLLLEVWRRLAPRIPVLARRAALGLGLVGLMLLEVWPANAYIYSETVVTTTLDRAGEAVRRSAPRLSRHVAVFESGRGTLDARSRRAGRYSTLRAHEVTALTEVPESDLDLVDFEIFGEDRLRGPDAAFYERRVRRFGPEAVETFRPEWFRVTGPARVLLSHPWRSYGRPEPIEWHRVRTRKSRVIGRLPQGLRAGQPVSIEAFLPRHSRSLAAVVVGELELPFLWTGWDERGERFSTRRFALPAANRRVRLEWDENPTAAKPPRLIVVRWRRRPPRPQAGRSSSPPASSALPATGDRQR